jgi:hypothetical protein
MLQNFTNILKDKIDIPSDEGNQSKYLFIFISKYKGIN